MKFRQVTVVILLSLLTGCSSREQPIHYCKAIRSPNQNDRVKYIVLHYTSADFGRSRDIFNDNGMTNKNPVSAHYLIPESKDASYRFRKIKVFQMVENNKRAWHAGASVWKNTINLNDQSIGIELVNLTKCQNVAGKNYCHNPDYDPQQIRKLILTLDTLMRQYPHIRATNIIGHSDIAPDRKLDPGPRFPWELLYRQGHGAWFDYATMVKYAKKFTIEMPVITTIQQAFKQYGYHIKTHGEVDQRTNQVVAAFQSHFVQDNVTGIIDVKTVAVLFALMEKYYPDWVAPTLVQEAIPS